MVAARRLALGRPIWHHRSRVGQSIDECRSDLWATTAPPSASWRWPSPSLGRRNAVFQEQRRSNQYQIAQYGLSASIFHRAGFAELPTFRASAASMYRGVATTYLLKSAVGHRVEQIVLLWAIVDAGKAPTPVRRAMACSVVYRYLLGEFECAADDVTPGLMDPLRCRR